MRNVVRSTLLAGLTGTLLVSVAWAGIGLAPVPAPLGEPVLAPAATEPLPETSGTPAPVGGVSPATLGADQLLVGAAKTSMYPDVEAMRTNGFPDAAWEKDPSKCKTLAPAWFQDLPKAAVNAMDGIANPGSVWPENPSCIYMGGFGLGPMNPVREFDKPGVDVPDNDPAVVDGLGLWVRSMAFSDGKQTLVTTVIDGEGWLWDYKSKCTDCGAKQIAAALAADKDLAGLGLTPASHVLHATHSHASPDFIGGWGFVPNWYMAQITDAIKSTAKQAVLTMEPATLEAGEEEARAHNSERRDTYRSAEEAAISWVRAVAVNSTPSSTPIAGAAVSTSPSGEASTEPSTEASAMPSGGPGRSGEAPGKPTAASPSPSPAPAPAAAAGPRVIATLGAFAAHPVTSGTNSGIAHADWVGLFNQRLEKRFGGIGLHFMTGLGNLTGANKLTGGALADLLPPVGAGRPVDDTTVKVSQTVATSALTNVPLTALGTPGLFDRKFQMTPAVVSVEDGDSNTLDNGAPAVGEPEPTAPCVSSSPQSVELPVSAARIGNDLVFTAAPGEVFANYTNTVKEKNAGRITFPLAQANDALGYMPQSFEINPVGQQALGFAAGGFLFVNYEDSYAIDRCTGDLMLEKTLELLTAVKAAK